MDKPIKVLAVVPARYASVRLPGKPLALVGGLPMVVRVYRQVVSSGVFADAVVATDDERILQACLQHGAKAIMTAGHHQNGTERTAEVAQAMPGFDYCVNVQGDEPFVSPDALRSLVLLLQEKRPPLATLYRKARSVEEVVSPHTAKVVLGQHGQALYFSRAAVPFLREGSIEDHLGDFNIHLGLYAYKNEVLQQMAALQPTPAESAEKLEQLRWIEHGFQVLAAETDYVTIAVDTAEDLKKAENYWKEQNP